jgi:hypothetical protein
MKRSVASDGPSRNFPMARANDDYDDADDYDDEDDRPRRRRRRVKETSIGDDAGMRLLLPVGRSICRRRLPCCSALSPS